MPTSQIPFSRPYRAPAEDRYLRESLASGHLHGDGPMTEAATRLVEEISGARRALLTTSCTHALELASLLLDLGPGDEVIVPSFTFSSTANAVAIRGATPVFVDIEPNTLNADPDAVAAAVTDRTRAIYVVHYGGVGADLERLQKVADSAGLAIVEDNAHGLGARLHGRLLGTFGVLATQSFHATKNVQCGEGGALLVNDDAMFERAEIIREKGTDRSRFLRGQVDKYTWNEVGSSFLPSDLLAALLRSQLEDFDDIQTRRHAVWSAYADALAGWADDHGVQPMVVPDGAEHPAHMYYLMMPSHDDQTGLIAHLRERGIVATFHYVPLDSSPAGRRLGRTPVPCDVTADRYARLVRLPLFAGLTPADVDRVVEGVRAYRPVG
ncbi:MAG: dTDP-4-amino-4,6-dideoxygalactose transaminase [Nocardioidaceae bacterium]